MVLTFGRVEGLAVQIASEPTAVVRVTVYLETTMGVDIVREVEVEPEVDPQRGIDLWWEADQWTQDTIAALLQPRGWELIGAMDPPSRDVDEVPRSPRYVMRTPFWVPPPGWDEVDDDTADNDGPDTPARG